MVSLAALRRPFQIAALGAVALATSGCDEGLGTACTSVFVAIPVTLMDTLGAPTDVTAQSVLVRSGEVLHATSLVLLAPGNFIIIDDGSLNRIRVGGDQVRVTASRSGGSVVQADYLINAPAGCHVNKVSGPDTLTVP
jgi:hypothetical protein